MTTDTYVLPIAGETILLMPSFDGGNSFVAPASVNTSRGVTLTVSTTTDEISDVTNPSKPAQTWRAAKSTDSKLDGAGILDKGDVAAYMGWAANGTANPVEMAIPVSNGIITVSGYYFLTSFQLTGTRASKATCTLTLEQANGVTVS